MYWGEIVEENGEIVPADFAGDHLPVYPCSGIERTYSSSFRKIPQEPDKRAAH